MKRSKTQPQAALIQSMKTETIRRAKDSLATMERLIESTKLCLNQKDQPGFPVYIGDLSSEASLLKQLASQFAVLEEVGRKTA